MRTNMVPTMRLPLTYATAAVTLLLGSSLLTINMSTAIDGYAEYTDKDSKLSSTRGPIFPERGIFRDRVGELDESVGERVINFQTNIKFQ